MSRHDAEEKARGARKDGRGGHGKRGKRGKKAGKGKGHDRRPDAEAGPAEAAVVPAPPEPAAAAGRPAGQRLYDMPFSSVSPRLIKPELGLHNLVARAGENAAYEIDVTLLDAPDHRLIRSGVLLAHRVVEGRGEWFLTAPDWQPLLPKDRIELMGHADLPDELASLIRPLRRRATLGPVAGLRCDRREFALRDDTGTTLALLRDDKVTVRRGGLTTARYREVMVTPVGPGLTEEQRAFLDRAFTGSGANRVPRFPRLVSRLGAPATGPSDIPDPQPYDPAASFRRFVGALVGRRLHAMVRADLAVRGGDAEAGARLGQEAAALRGELVGLSDALAAEWAEDLVDDLGWLVAAATPAAGVRPEGLLAGRLRSERYLALLERLVGAARSPLVRTEAAAPAAEVLAGLLRTGTAGLVEAAGVLTADGPADERDAQAWERARTRLEVLHRLTEVAAPVLPEEAARLARVLRKPVARMAEVRPGTAHVVPDLTTLTPAQAFEAGRELERAAERRRRAKQDFVERWAKASRGLAG